MHFYSKELSRRANNKFEKEFSVRLNHRANLNHAHLSHIFWHFSHHVDSKRLINKRRCLSVSISSVPKSTITLWFYCQIDTFIIGIEILVEVNSIATIA